MFDRHREVCLRCQAEAAQLRSVSRDIGGLDDEVVRAPGGFHTQVMATLPQQDASDPRRPLVMRLVVRRAVVAVVVAVAMLAAILGRRVRRKE
jgi:anti-sigma factor RsiW